MLSIEAFRLDEFPIYVYVQYDGPYISTQLPHAGRFRSQGSFPQKVKEHLY